MVGLVEPLVAAGLRAVAMDMPAHGHSAGRQTGVLDMAAAVRAVARSAGRLRGILGHSMGGAAAALALADGLQADAAVLLAPGAEPLYFARRLAKWLGLSPPRVEGMLRRVQQRLGGAWVELEVRNLVRALDVPMLLLQDPEDTEVPWAHGEAIAAAWPGARLEAVPGLGHSRLLRDPAVIARAVAHLKAGRG
jgi:pimeloyl-ACP methyl ester carboxylesterase